MQNITQQLPERQYQGGASLSTVQRITEAELPTEYGDFKIVGYRSFTSPEEFIVLIKGALCSYRASLVRIHSQCMTGDVFASTRCDCGRQLQEAMRLITAEGHGVIIYQQQEGRGIGIINKIRAYALQDEGADTVEANEQLGLDIDSRHYEQCAEILSDLGLQKVRVLSNNPLKIHTLEQLGLEVVERVALEIQPAETAMRYLRTKKEKMGHLINID
jgi:3,4-dihydroxy 2-butanone 4-phosphate synthase/GTP cyclohydrolase II